MGLLFIFSVIKPKVMACCGGKERFVGVRSGPVPRWAIPMVRPTRLGVRSAALRGLSTRIVRAGEAQTSQGHARFAQTSSFSTFHV